MSHDQAKAKDQFIAGVLRSARPVEVLKTTGIYSARCFDRDGRLKWEDTVENTVMTEGKNEILDQALAGAGYTVTGPFMGLVSSVSYSAIAATDTAAQINGTNGWKEAGSGSNFPLYTTPRKTAAWSAASGGVKSLSAALDFPIITTGGTVKGAFLVFASGAISTIAATGGKLLSAGLFSGGDKVVSPGDTIQVSYQLTLT